ncbi:MAG: hypothetical protein K0R28_1305 [Paenibacillus sp.]|nr:hypothetical protein [Paenibacillus sp.]
MKIYIMTDIEGVCGLVNFDDWAIPEGRYYEEGKKLLTMEVNAAIEGFFNAGATEILVVDGHGHGAIHNILLDNRVRYLRGPVPGPFPFMLDESFDAIAWVGQHAKAGTEFAQMAHTGSFNVIDYKINDVSVGEFGIMALCAGFYGVRAIFGSGDEAFAKEASQLIEGIETVSVKRGTMPGSGDECNSEKYKKRNNGAIHIHPEKARDLIRKGAEHALSRFSKNKEQFPLLTFHAPFRKEITYRSEENKPAYTKRSEYYDNIIHAINS